MCNVHLPIHIGIMDIINKLPMFLSKFPSYLKNEIDYMLRLANRRDMTRVDTRNVDLIAAHPLDHLDLGFLGRRCNRLVTLGDQVRDWKVILAIIGEVASETSGRVFYQLPAPIFALF